MTPSSVGTISLVRGLSTITKLQMWLADTFGNPNQVKLYSPGRAKKIKLGIFTQANSRPKHRNFSRRNRQFWTRNFSFEKLLCLLSCSHGGGLSTIAKLRTWLADTFGNPNQVKLYSPGRAKKSNWAFSHRQIHAPNTEISKGEIGNFGHTSSAFTSLFALYPASLVGA